LDKTLPKKINDDVDAAVALTVSTTTPSALPCRFPPSGIKSVRALEAYIGYDEEVQDEAMEISE